MLWLAAMFALGIAAGAYWPFSLAVLVPASVIFGIAALASARTWHATVYTSVAFALAGSAVYSASVLSPRADRVKVIYDQGQIPSGDPVEITGTVTGSVESSPDGFFLLVAVDSIVHQDASRNASGTVRLFAAADTREMMDLYQALDLSAGTQVKIACELSREDGFLNPGVLPRKKLLEWQDLDATGFIRSPIMVENLGWRGRIGILNSVYAVRDGLTDKFREMFAPQVAGVMIASLLGNKYFLDAGTAGIFREGGTFHILVISGLHITFIGGIAALFVGLFTKRKGVQFLVVCTFLWAYTIAVGAEVPVVRASLMFTILWFSYVIHRTASLANALGTCGMILLAWRPGDLFGPSFQLTFVSVSAIVIAGFPLISKLRAIGTWVPTREHPFPANVPDPLRRFCETIYWNEQAWEIESRRNVWTANLFKSPFAKLQGAARRTVAYILEGIIVSLIVQIAMLPLVVHYFHRVTPISVLLNIWTGVLIAVESFSSLIAVAFSYFSESLALPFVRLAEGVHWLMISIPGQLTDLGWLSFRVPVYSGMESWLYALYLILIGVIGTSFYIWDPFAVWARVSQAFFGSKTIMAAVGFALLIGLVLIFHPFSGPWADGRLHVEFLDVGQGDSAFITFPNGETMLVDGGGRRRFRDADEGDEPFEPDVPSIGETVVSEFLWERGYSSIDRIVATHADADHIQGLQAVVRNFRIGEAWFGQINGTDTDETNLIDALNKRRTPLRTVSRGDHFEIGGVTVEVLGPGGEDVITTRENNRSVVLRLVFGSRSFLLTGDIEKGAESEMLSNGGDLQADVVKVPHHGSRTSSTIGFVTAVRPDFAVIPVGRKSQFNHPHPEIVDRWRSAGAEVLTTGERGTITFSTDGADLMIREFVPE